MNRHHATYLTNFVVHRAALLVLVLCTLPCLTGCETVDKVRMKLFGIVIENPERETAEWVLRETLMSASDPDEQAGWARFQKVLHSDERTTNALKGWHSGNWPRMRRQASYYLDEQGRFILRDFRIQQNDGIDFFLENRFRDLPTPCAVHRDINNNGLWRIKRCSL